MDKLLIPWMKQIAYHVCCDFAKQIAGRHETATDLSDDTQASFSGTLEAPDCFQSVFDKDTALQLNTALSKLPVKIRQAFLLRYEQELKLEEIADSFEGVDKSYAIQAGREVRIIVKPEKVSEAEMTLIARDVAKRVESEMEYPGQIKINVIRESRVVEYAK